MEPFWRADPKDRRHRTRALEHPQRIGVDVYASEQAIEKIRAYRSTMPKMVPLRLTVGAGVTSSTIQGRR